MTKKDSKYENVTHLTYLRTGQSHSCIHCGKQFHMDRISECANHYINDHEYKLSSARLGREASLLLVREKDSKKDLNELIVS